MAAPSNPPADPAATPAAHPATAPAAHPAALSPATVVVAAGRPPARPGEGVNVPLTLSSTYHAAPGADAPGGRVYGRWDNATWEALESVLGTLEGGRALTFASGMAAIAAALGEVPQGGVVVAPGSAYSGTLALLHELESAGRLGLRQVDVADTAAVARAADGADLVWVETPTNPMLEVADLPELVARVP